MKKIRTASGGILFLEDEDYMPKLLAYLRETAGHDAADLVEAYAEEAKRAFRRSLDVLNNMVDDLKKKAEEEVACHIEEISELEEELTRVAGLKDEAVAFNRALVDLVENPEKLFPEIGSKVFRFVGKELSKTEHGRIDAYKLRTDSRTKRPEFFVRISWNRAWGNGFVSDPYWYKFKNIGKSFHVGDPTDYVKDASTADDVIEEAEG